MANIGLSNHTKCTTLREEIFATRNFRGRNFLKSRARKLRVSRKKFLRVETERHISRKKVLQIEAIRKSSEKKASFYASPLVQGGLEIPCFIKAYMPRTVKNKQITSMYEEMTEGLCQEKDVRPVIGSILNCSETTEPADIERRGRKRTRN